MTLKPLREYFTNDGKLIQNLTTFTASLPFYHIGVYIDNWLLWWYGNEMANDTNFLAYVNAWLGSCGDRLSNIYNALKEVYNPLENYNMIEQSGKANSRAELKTKTSREGNVKTTTNPGTMTTIDSRTTDSDDVTLRPYTKSETYGDTTGTIVRTEEEGTNHGIHQSTEYAGTETLTTPSGDVQVNGNEVEINELKRSGNIGVTTSQDMLKSEVELRIAYDFTKNFCEIFERECLTGVFDYGYNY